MTSNEVTTTMDRIVVSQSRPAFIYHPFTSQQVDVFKLSLSEILQIAIDICDETVDDITAQVTAGE
jgi:hypothetical protein